MTSRLSIRDSALGLALLAIVAFFAIMVPNGGFLESRNLTLLLIDYSIAATLAIGMLVVILPGHIDLSAGSGVGLIGGIAAVCINAYSWPAPLALAGGLAVGLILWWAMGSLIVRERMPAFIITLGGMLIFKGLFLLVIGSRTIPIVTGGQTNLYSALTTTYLTPLIGYSLAALVIAVMVYGRLKARAQRRAHNLATEDGEVAFLKLFLTAQVVLLFVTIMNQFRGVALPVLIVSSVAVVAWVLTQQTPWGRHLYAIGGNEEAAVVSGIPVERVTIGAFVFMGVTVSMTGFMQTAYVGASTTTIGDLMELDAVAACVIGGVGLKGGRGTVLGVLIGTLIIVCLLNGMQQMAVRPERKLIARGVVLILAVWMDVRLSRMAVKEAV